MTCTIPSGLAVSATASFIIPVTPTAAAQPSVTNTATVSGGGDPACPGPARCSSSVGPTPVNAPQLTITKTASASPWTVGVAASYTLSVQNTGTAATTAASTISDTIPAGLTIGALPGGCGAVLPGRDLHDPEWPGGRVRRRASSFRSRRRRRRSRA